MNKNVYFIPYSTTKLLYYLLNCFKTRIDMSSSPDAAPVRHAASFLVLGVGRDISHLTAERRLAKQSDPQTKTKWENFTWWVTSLPSRNSSLLLLLTTLRSQHSQHGHPPPLPPLDSTSDEATVRAPLESQPGEPD